MRAPSLTLLVSAAAAAWLLVACGAGREPAPTVTAAPGVVEIAETDVERMSIGCTWLYAHAEWIESMHATGAAAPASGTFEVSRSYAMYWNWFEQLSAGTATSISTGGNWAVANAIAEKYGVIPESAFLGTTDAATIISRQTAALSEISTSLATGPLSSLDARRDTQLVRSELDRAWALQSAARATLDQVFGSDVSRTFNGKDAQLADASGTAVQRTHDVAVTYASGPGVIGSPRTLHDAIREWQNVYYAPSDRRGFQVRVQRAMQDKQPVILTWFVDFNALESRAGTLFASFNLTTLGQLGPGQQGGHSALVTDYRARLANGQVVDASTAIGAGVTAQALLAGALLPSTQLELFRVKNEWGTAHPARALATGMPAYHDLYFDYLNGPVEECVVRGGATDTSDCPSTVTPLQDVVLPPGY